MTEEEFKITVEKLKIWLASSEGKTTLAKLREEGEKRRKEMAERTKLSWEDLHRPVDF